MGHGLNFHKISFFFKMIRIGTHTYTSESKLDNFLSVPCISNDLRYRDLSPFLLKDENGHLMENVWQYSKLYPMHYDAKTQTVTEDYWSWRQKGMDSVRAVRYPVGAENRHTCLGSILNKEEPQLLNYVDARKKIYLPLYCKLVKQAPSFKKLQQHLSEGKNLLLIDWDGPKERSLDHYKTTYGVSSTFIEHQTMEASVKNLAIMLNDTKHSFGHAYCLAAALLGVEEEVLSYQVKTQTLHRYFCG